MSQEIKSFEIKTPEELATYGTARGGNSLVPLSSWNKLFSGNVAGIGYPRVVKDANKNYDNRITPPQEQLNKAKALNKKIRITASECKEFFTITLVDVVA